ncbi:MAG TPA: FAD-binding oxidoreductase [Caulobacteraceae bacterium]|nr:FAD-binding oxidoreductase [Caulobacteraceae bacterium]
MPGPPVVPVRGDEALPAKVDVVVIGGGIIGASTTLELTERGHSVALCEKGEIAHEQSSRNWGWVRLTQRDPREAPLMAQSLRIWADLDKRTGRDVGYTRAGIAFALPTEKAVAGAEGWLDSVRELQVDARVLTAGEFGDLFPGGRLALKGALYSPTDGRAEPQRATSAIAETAREKGAALLTRCAVRGLELKAGAVCGVVTERGPIACDAVVLAGGAWSSLFAGSLGLRLPQLKVLNSILRTEPLPDGPGPALWADGFAFRGRADGGYTVAPGHGLVVDVVPDSFRFFGDFVPALTHTWRSLSLRFGDRFFEEAATPRRWALDKESPFERCRILDPKPKASLATAALARLAKSFPAFEKAKVAQVWAGLIDSTPDIIPVIDKVAAVPGFHIATGFSGHGFGIGPAAGRLMADIVTGRAPIVDPTPLRFSRFGDGSKIEPMSGL